MPDRQKSLVYGSHPQNRHLRAPHFSRKNLLMPRNATLLPFWVNLVPPQQGRVESSLAAVLWPSNGVLREGFSVAGDPCLDGVNGGSRPLL